MIMSSAMAFVIDLSRDTKLSLSVRPPTSGDTAEEVFLDREAS